MKTKVSLGVVCFTVCLIIFAPICHAFLTEFVMMCNIIFCWMVVLCMRFLLFIHFCV
jgi:hypothetical protein